MLEVMLSLVIFGGCIAVIGEISRSAFRNAREARDSVQAELLAESILSKVLLGIIEQEPAADVPVSMLTARSDEIADTHAVSEGNVSDILWFYSLEITDIDDNLIEIAVTVRQNVLSAQQPVVCRLVRWTAVEPESESETGSETEETAAETTGASSPAY